MNINIKTIPAEKQRYPTAGDWTFDHTGDLNIYISDMGNWKYELLVAVHELIEVALCKDREIAQEVVDKFDMDFEAAHKEGEPGDEPDAPYRREHLFATGIEKLLAAELGVDWKQYDTEIVDVTNPDWTK